MMLGFLHRDTVYVVFCAREWQKVNAFVRRKVTSQSNFVLRRMNQTLYIIC
jgi:hypothetical protein